MILGGSSDDRVYHRISSLVIKTEEYHPHFTSNPSCNCGHFIWCNNRVCISSPNLPIVLEALESLDELNYSRHQRVLSWQCRSINLRRQNSSRSSGRALHQIKTRPRIPKECDYFYLRTIRHHSRRHPDHNQMLKPSDALFFTIFAEDRSILNWLMHLLWWEGNT